LKLSAYQSAIGGRPSVDDRQDVALLDDEQVVPIDVHLGTRVLSVQPPRISSVSSSGSTTTRSASGCTFTLDAVAI
jgi:hypothetical protein